jgi:Tfp pilus assembly pilus retraction ATPase PilT
MRRIRELDIKRIVKKVINEDDKFVTGVAASERTELVDDVINRINEHGMKYIMALNELNFNFPTEKYKRQDRVKRSDFELPKGVRVKSSHFPD